MAESSSRPSSRPASPETTRSSSPRPGRLMKTFRRRMTSTFRRNSVSEDSPSSRPGTPEISEGGDALAHPTKDSEPVVEEPPKKAMLEDIPASPLTPNPHTNAVVPQPDVAEPIIPAQDDQEAAHKEEDKADNVEPVNLAQEDQEVAHTEEDTPPPAVDLAVHPDTPAAADNAELQVPEVPTVLSESPSHSPAPSMPIPELHQHSSISSLGAHDIPISAPQPRRHPSNPAEDPFSTPSNRSSIVDDVRVVEPHETQHSGSGLSWEHVPLPRSPGFDKAAFDALVDDFAEKYAENLSARNHDIQPHLTTLLLRAAARILSTDEEHGDRAISSSSAETGGFPVPSTDARAFQRVRVDSLVTNSDASSVYPQSNGYDLTNPHSGFSGAHTREATDMQSTFNRLSKVGVPEVPLTSASPPPHAKLEPWNEHRLPDGVLYFTRPLSRYSQPSKSPAPSLLLVTDIDLREKGALERVESFLLSRGDEEEIVNLHDGESVEEGRDIWLAFATTPPAEISNNIRGSNSGPDPTNFKVVVVDHARHTTLPHIDHETLKSGNIDDVAFQLAMEHAYWTFVESHPAHRVASYQDRDAAMSFLAWCFADQLVQSESNEQHMYPFSIDQCKELMELLRSVDTDPELFPKQLDSRSMISSRIIAKISLRNLSWRQALYASNKADAAALAAESAPPPPIDSLPTNAVEQRRPPVPQGGVMSSGMRSLASLIYATTRVFFFIPLAGFALVSAAARMVGVIRPAHVAPRPASFAAATAPKPRREDAERASLLANQEIHTRLESIIQLSQRLLESRSHQQHLSTPPFRYKPFTPLPCNEPRHESFTKTAMHALMLVPATACITSLAGGMLAFSVTRAILNATLEPPWMATSERIFTLS